MGDITEVNYRMKRLLIGAVENQLRGNTPKATKETFERLISRGYDRAAAKEMIASVLLEEIYYMLKDGRRFNEEEFTKKLSKLL